MTARRRPWQVLAALALLAPAGAHAQDPPKDQTEARPTGLPAKISWTFNLDAGWGIVWLRQLALPQYT